MAEPDLFASRPEQHQPPPRRNVGPPPQVVARLTALVNEVGSRLAVLEERLQNVRRKSRLNEDAFLAQEKEAKADLKALTESVTEIAGQVHAVQTKVDEIAGELANTVRRHEFTVLERYMDLWEPVEFMTRAEAKELLKAALRKP